MSLPKQSKPILRIPLPINKSVGLGDVVKSVTTKMGFTPCGGCQQRAAVLNQWVGFTPTSKS